MFRWLTERRRRRILEAPFPAAWDGYIARNVAIARRLGVAERMRLRELVQVFLAEKHFEGCGGLELTDEVRVTIERCGPVRHSRRPRIYSAAGALGGLGGASRAPHVRSTTE